MLLNLKNIYQKRYSDRKWREAMWKILVKDFFQQFIDPEDIVLEIACGYGEFINNIKCKKKIAIDANYDSQKFLNKKVVFYHGQSNNLKWIKNNSIDKVFVSNFFEHITREDIVKTIGELKRVLKKNGQILILQPNFRFLSKDYWMFFDHITPIDDRALIEIFESYNLSLRKKKVRFLPYTTKSYFPKWPFLIKIYLKIPLLWLFFGKQSFLIFQK